MTIVGIDYSLSCPAVCILGENSFWKSEFYFLSNRKRDHARVHTNIWGAAHQLYKTDEQRYDQISDWALSKFSHLDNVNVFVEGYSMGSKGLIFNLAENCGLLKHKVFKKQMGLHVVAPTAVKKFATGKGNADKNKMYEAFLQEAGNPELNKLLSTSDKVGSPVSDIVDAYFIAKWGYNQLCKNSR